MITGLRDGLLVKGADVLGTKIKDFLKTPVGPGFSWFSLIRVIRADSWTRKFFTFNMFYF